MKLKSSRHSSSSSSTVHSPQEIKDMRHIHSMHSSWESPSIFQVFGIHSRIISLPHCLILQHLIRFSNLFEFLFCCFLLFLCRRCKF